MNPDPREGVGEVGRPGLTVVGADGHSLKVSSPALPPCKACGRKDGTLRRRGLCGSCYYSPKIRKEYPIVKNEGVKTRVGPLGKDRRLPDEQIRRKKFALKRLREREGSEGEEGTGERGEKTVAGEKKRNPLAAKGGSQVLSPIDGGGSRPNGVELAPRGPTGRGGRYLAPEPTQALPGTEAKVRVMIERVNLGQEVFHPRDRTLDGWAGGASIFNQRRLDRIGSEPPAPTEDTYE